MDHWRADTPRGPMTQYGSRRLMDVGLRRLPIVVGLVDLDAGIEEAEDSANVIPGDVAARLADPAALRAFHNPFVPVLFAHPQTSEASRATTSPNARRANTRLAI